jgi:hypothetical protein
MMHRPLAAFAASRKAAAVAVEIAVCKIRGT